jgi:hypothetical protein
MLDRSKVMRELRDISDKLFIDISPAYEKAQELWDKVSNDPLFLPKVMAIQEQVPWLVPTWQGELADMYPVKQTLDRYRALSVDGSQIYPDRHQGTSCFLINIGTVLISYGMEGKAVLFDSIPFVYTQEGAESSESAMELVNCRRQEFEFEYGLKMNKKIKEMGDQDAPLLFMFDGSLIFWHLESKDAQLKDQYLSKYLLSLHQLYQQKVLIAGYISLPKNKELVNLLRLELSNFNIPAGEANKELEVLVDTNIGNFFLEPYTRSTIFKNHASICKHYPNHLHPHFFYLNVGSEIARIEIPAWIAKDQELVDLVAQIMLDQTIKGRGYPVAIAEAHEQAVVKGPDREFFYQLINKIGFERNQRLSMSQKSIKKRGIGI